MVLQYIPSYGFLLYIFILVMRCICAHKCVCVISLYTAIHYTKHTYVLVGCFATWQHVGDTQHVRYRSGSRIFHLFQYLKISKVNSVYKISKKFVLLFFSFQLKWKWQKIDICFWIHACEHKLHIHVRITNFPPYRHLTTIIIIIIIVKHAGKHFDVKLWL